MAVAPAAQGKASGRVPAEPVAVVTGSGRGIGAAIARRLAADGCRVALLDADPEGGLWELAAELGEDGARAIECDVRDTGSVRRALDEAASEWGGVHIAVANAGVTRDAVSWKLSDEEWSTVLEVNLTGAFHLARAAIPHMRGAGWGRIVAVSSINGLRGKFGQANYAASKAGMIGLVKSLAREVGAFGITANAVAPGMVETAMVAALPEVVVQAARSEGVIGRLVRPEEVAAAVAFLCTESAAAVTGETLRVDGGQYI